MKITPTNLPGVLILEPRVWDDGRGFFLETFNAERFASVGLPTHFPQDNFSRSVRGTLRGLHYQLRRPQGKLISVLSGHVYDVVVDIRRGSPTFGRWFGKHLTAEQREFIWIPPGLAHGFCVLSEFADFSYKCTDTYQPNDDHGVIWSDPGLGIDWPVSEPILSDKDQRYAPLSAARSDLPLFHE